MGFSVGSAQTQFGGKMGASFPFFPTFRIGKGINFGTVWCADSVKNFLFLLTLICCQKLQQVFMMYLLSMGAAALG